MSHVHSNVEVVSSHQSIKIHSKQKTSLRNIIQSFMQLSIVLLLLGAELSYLHDVCWFSVFMSLHCLFEGFFLSLFKYFVFSSHRIRSSSRQWRMIYEHVMNFHYFIRRIIRCKGLPAAKLFIFRASPTSTEDSREIAANQHKNLTLNYFAKPLASDCVSMSTPHAPEFIYSRETSKYPR